METKQILEQLRKFNEQEQLLTVKDICNIINNSLHNEWELEGYEELGTTDYSTLYNKYTMYHFKGEYLYILPLGDFKSICSDVANTLAATLPDGFEKFIDIQPLATNMEHDTYYLLQAIKFINKQDHWETELEEIKSVDFSDYNGISYALLEM